MTSEESPLRVDHDRGQTAVSDLPFLAVVAIGIVTVSVGLRLWRLVRLLLVAVVLLFFAWLLQSGHVQLAL